MKKRFAKSFILIIALVLIHQLMQHETRACNVAVVTASASATGRPFLWKNRDHADSYKQQVLYYPEVIEGVGGSLRLMGETTFDSGVAVCTGGANESGFAIANTTCYESVALEAANVNTELMEVALEECRTLADFEQIASEFTSRWSGSNISGIFAVIDAYNGAAIYEMWTDGNGNDIMYRKFDANTGYVTDENGSSFSDIKYTQTVGFNNRTNSNHTNDWIDIWTDTPRELRARQLMTEMLANNELSPRNLMRQVAKDVCGGDPVDYCSAESKVLASWDDEEDSYDNPNRDGEMYTRYCISRYQTSMGLVVEGAAAPDEANLTTMWVALGEPSLSVFVPFFPAAGEVSKYAYHDEHANSDDDNSYYWNGTWESYDNEDNSFLNLLFDCVQSNPFGTSHPLYSTYNNIELYNNNGSGAFTDTQDRNDGEYYGWFTYKMDTTINYPRLVSLQTWTLPLEDNVHDHADEFTSLLRADTALISSEELAGFSNYCNQYVYQNYTHQSDEYALWARDLPDNGVAPSVSSVYPADESTGFSVSDVITARFSEAMDESSINEDTFGLFIGATRISGSVAYDSSTLTATLYPDSGLQYATAYNVILADDIQDLAGNAIAGGYSWNFTTASDGSSDNVAPTVSSVVSGSGTAVPVTEYISVQFSESMDESSIDNSTFSLLIGATEVAGFVDYDADSYIATFYPNSNLQYDTTYTVELTSGITDVAGNGIAGGYAWNFTTESEPSDETAPTVSSIYPADESTGFSVSGVITARFSEAMDETSINTDTFELLDDGINVAGSVTYNSSTRTATFNPDSDLAASTVFTVELSSGMTDEAGNGIAGGYSWTFATETNSNDNPPTVASIFPVDDATDVPVNTAVAALFSEAMDGDTINENTFELFAGSTEVSGSVTYNSSTNTATFNPDSDLAADTVFTVELSSGITDGTGNALTGGYSWTFTTADEPSDNIAPTISSFYPSDESAGFSVSGVITVKFSEAMDESSIDDLTFGLFIGSTRVAGYVDYDSDAYIAAFYPDSDLQYDTAYTVTLADDMQDAAGNAMAGGYSWTFTTASAPSDGDAPTVTWVYPSDDSTDFPVWKAITVKFSEAMDENSINDDTFVLYRGNTRVPGSITYNPSTFTATFDPVRNLATYTGYTVVLTGDIKDESDIGMASGDFWNFTTEGDPFGRAKRDSGSSDGCGSIAEASTLAGGTRPIMPGVMSLAVTMLFPLSLMMLHRTARRRNRE